MTAIHRDIIGPPEAWTVAEVGGKAGVTINLSEQQLQAIEDILDSTRRLAPQAVSREQFWRPVLEPMFEEARQRLMHGAGLVLVAGITHERFAEADFERIYWGLGLHTGVPAYQIGQPREDLMGHVNYVPEETNKLGYRSHTELDMHCDTPQIVGLMCVRKAKSGGLSRFSSGLAIHDEILRTRPDLLEPLYRGSPHYRLGWHMAGEPDTTPWAVPVFCEVDGVVSMHFASAIYAGAARKGETLPEDLQEALAYFQEIAKRPDRMLEFMLEPGEMTVWNNRTVLHSRTAYQDGDTHEDTRHLLRLWMDALEPRPAAPEMDTCIGKPLAARALNRLQFEAAPA